MVLSSVGADGQPSSRIVYLRAFDARGFVWFTNYQSRKGREVDAHPRAALNFFWAAHSRQVRVEGTVARVDAAQSDAYFAGRPRESQVGAWASQQSEPLPPGRTLEALVADTRARLGDGPIPRPPHWGGYRLIPDTLEFWRMGAFRLHERDKYRRTTDGWARVVLFP